FGAHLFLIGFAGFSALQRATESYSGTTALYAREVQTERLLGDLRSDVLLSAIEARDIFLLLSLGAERQGRLARLRQSSRAALHDLTPIIPAEYRERLDTLTRQVNAYWDVLSAIPASPSLAKPELHERFLIDRILPKRQIVLNLAAEMERLTRDSIRKHRNEIDSRQAGLPLYVAEAIGGTLLIGMLVAAASLAGIARAERIAAERHRTVADKEEELRRLSQKLVKAQEEERRSLSRDLHDQIGQVLTAVRISVGNVEEALHNPAASDKAEVHLEQAKRLSEQALRSVREIAMGLRPAMLDDLGLGAALEWQARQFSRLCDIPVTARVCGDLDALSEAQRVCVYRVVQEALNNAAKHANASEILIAVSGTGTDIRIEVRDNGAGFDSALRREPGLGLVGIKERVRQLGGDADISSRPGSGTTLLARIPLRFSPEAV
ncbi:MAG: sensor histidine kinase, partial [Acidobacteriota bacterium]|nr:sensor histidine kinase [Acidobacteriota bacterium]